jgi:ADP-heptose:LPS heptosyltransferase
MQIQTMRNIDRFFGVPLCWIAAGFLSLIPRKKLALSQGEVRNILVIKFFGLGSIILSTAALSMLRTRFPDATITFLSFESNREILDRIPLIDNVVTIDTTTPWTFVRDLFLLLRMLSRTDYGIVFDFEFFSKFSTVLGGISRAPYRVGFSLPARWRSLLLTHPVSLVKGRHVKEAFCSQIQALFGDATVEDIMPPVLLPRDLTSLQHKLPLNHGSFVAVNVNAGDTFLERRWPADRFADLISTLSRESDFLFVLTGTRRERAYVQGVIDCTGSPERCWNAAGLITIPELGALLQRCTFVISNDSGPLHLAAALGAPTIGLFGPESPEFYGPVGSLATSVYKELPCSPCMNVYSAKTFRCPYDAQCMKNIQVSDVQQIIEEVLAVA